MKDNKIIFDPTNDVECAIVSDSSLSTAQVIERLKRRKEAANVE